MNQPDPTNQSTPDWLQAIVITLQTGCIAILAMWAFQAPLSQSNALSPRSIAPCVMDIDGYLRGEIFGKIKTTLDWSGSKIGCDGMLRPNGTGIRLAFAEHANEAEPGLLIVFGIATASPGEPVKEAPVNITIIDQQQGLFFATPEEPRCWSNFTEQLKLHGTVEETWRINGEVYCMGALPAINGTGTITLSELQFSGVFKPTID